MRRYVSPAILAALAFAVLVVPSEAQQARPLPAHQHNEPRAVDQRTPDAFDLALAAWERTFVNSGDFRPGMTVAEIGAGTGEFAVRLADRVGPTGRVFANELDLGKLERIRDRSAQRPNATITPILGAEYDPLLPAGETDVAVMIEVFHHLTDKARFLAATRGRLRPGGRLIIVEPDVRQPGGQPDGCYSHPFESRTLAERAGYRFERFDWFKVDRLEMFALVLTVPPRG